MPELGPTQRMTRNSAYRWAKRISISVIGFTVLAIGVAMVVLPGPALVVIPAGLGILSLEYAWARTWLKRVKDKGAELAHAAAQRARRRNP